LQKLRTDLNDWLLASQKVKQDFKIEKAMSGKEEIPKNWKIMSIEQISSNVVGGGTPSTTTSEYWDGNISWTKSSVLTKHYLDHGERFITKKGLENCSSEIIPKNNLLIASRVSMGNMSINLIDIAINQDITGIIVNKSIVSAEFLYWMLLSHLKKLTNSSQGSTIKGFTRKEILKFKIPIPPLPEQEKIASILKNIDLLIFKNKKIIGINHKSYDIEMGNNLERLKKGLMQKLLTGKIRVKV